MVMRLLRNGTCGCSSAYSRQVPRGIERPETRELAYSFTIANRSRQTAERPAKNIRVSSAQVEEQIIADPADDEQVLVEVETLPAEILEPQEAVERLFEVVHPFAEKHYHAFFSSELGGITTEPALMTIHMDDHLVHRGHGVFDTALLVEGNLYLLDAHLERFADSIERALLPLPCSMAQIRRIILETTAASKKMDGFVRFWVGGGRGGFGISTRECLRSSFYCLVTTFPEGSAVRAPASDYLRGRKVKSTPVPFKHPYFATLKSNNYLANALATIDAEDEGFDYGIFADEEGYYTEGPTMNVAIVTKEGELVIPPFDNCLAGITVRRLMELIPEHIDSVSQDTDGKLTRVVQRKINRQDVYEAVEAMLIGSTTYVTSITRWDDMDKGDGVYGDQPGITALVLRALLKKDLDPVTGPPENFTEVPYGILTNMMD